jgi:lipid-A-disaccharide synthase
VVYYISPQLWAWRPGRVRQVKALVDQMLCILPFEPEFYAGHGVPARYVGHPLVEELAAAPARPEARARLGVAADERVVALLPGSRTKEVQRHLPTMLAALRILRQRMGPVRALVPVAETLDPDAVRAVAGAEAMVTEGRAVECLRAADAAMVCSGTSTLQAALLERPMVIVYRVSWLTYWLLRSLVRVAHIGLVNLIAGRRLMPELVQGAFTAEAGAAAVEALLAADYTASWPELRAKLGNQRSAEEVARVLRSYA